MAATQSADLKVARAWTLKERFRQYFQVWDAALGRQAYAAGDELTIADVSLYAGWVRTKGTLPDLCEGLPNLDRWAAEMAARPSMQRAVRF